MQQMQIQRIKITSTTPIEDKTAILSIRSPLMTNSLTLFHMSSYQLTYLTSSTYSTSFYSTVLSSSFLTTTGGGFLANMQLLSRTINPILMIRGPSILLVSLSLLRLLLRDDFFSSIFSYYPKRPISSS